MRALSAAMDPAGGWVTWIHTQEGGQPSHSAVHCDVAAKGAGGPSPAPWIGDVDVLRRRAGQPISGQSHLMVAVGDLDGDGDEDLIVQSEFYSMWAERSFLERGYAPASRIGEESRR